MAASRGSVVIVGGGVVGSFAAYWLKVLGGSGGPKVTLIERDAQFETTSAVLSAGGVRQQFSLAENINLSLKSSQFLKHRLEELMVEGDEELPTINFNEAGYLFLAGTEEGANTIRANHKLQTSLGAKIELMDPAALKTKWPYLKVDDLVLGAFGVENEGYFDPYLLLQAVRRKIKSQGVECVSAEAVGLDMSEDGKTIQSVIVRDSSRTYGIPCGTVVNAAGAWSGHLAKLAGIDLPVEPRPRTVYAIDAPKMAEYFPGKERCPLTVDPLGAYFRGDGGSPSRFICGKSPTAEVDVTFDGCQSIEEVRAALDCHPCSDWFQNEVWPIIATRATPLEELKVTSSWAGCYEYNTWDENGIIGPHPGGKNMFFCSGFSGHGLQMSPYTGRAVAEYLLNGKYDQVDVTRFGYERILEGKKVLEVNIV